VFVPRHRIIVMGVVVRVVKMVALIIEVVMTGVVFFVVVSTTTFQSVLDLHRSRSSGCSRSGCCRCRGRDRLHRFLSLFVCLFVMF